MCRFAYRVLIAKETAIIETCVRISHAKCQAGTIRVGRKIIDKVQVVGSEISVPKRGVWRNWKTCGATARQIGVEVRGDCQSGGIGIVARACDCRPDNVDDIATLVFDIASLSKEIDRPSSSDIHLLRVVARQNQDVCRRCRVR